jgi:hypothetical protein
MNTDKQACCSNRRLEGHGIGMEVLWSILLMLGIGVIATSLPELKRYLRIRRM